jgi:hypothetical protein
MEELFINAIPAFEKLGVISLLAGGIWYMSRELRVCKEETKVAMGKQTENYIKMAEINERTCNILSQIEKRIEEAKTNDIKEHSEILESMSDVKEIVKEIEIRMGKNV